MYYATTATRKIASLEKRIRGISGGTSASKTVSVIIYLIARAQADTVPTLTSIVSESFPHLKRGAMRDFLLIMQEHKYFDDKEWNRSDYTYTFSNGSKIEFFSADMPGKVRGPRRDRLFMNEANNIGNGFEIFEQLEVRTKEFVIMDWNPTNEFWFYTEVLNKRDDVDFLTLTYLDNEALSKDIVQSIEQRKNRKGWWQVYGLGQLGEVDGKIYKGWDIVDEVDKHARLERIGVDFGYSNDPTAIVAVYYMNGGYILDEITFLKGLSNKQIADILGDLETRALVIADSAEPKSIDEIRSYGINISGAVKKAEKTGAKKTYNEWAIQIVQNQKISMTKRSVNIINEYRNFLWQTDKDGNIKKNPSEPEHQFSHTMDAIKYAIVSIVNKPNFTKVKASELAKPYYENFS